MHFNFLIVEVFSSGCCMGNAFLVSVVLTFGLEKLSIRDSRVRHRILVLQRVRVVKGKLQVVNITRLLLLDVCFFDNPFCRTGT